MDDESKSVASPEAYLKTCGRGKRWRDGLPLRHRSTIFRSEVAVLSNQRADILITHEAPELHKHGSAVIGQVARLKRAKMAFHGHHHQDITYPGGVWRDVGLRGIVMITGETMRAGDPDV